jgi:hypothetical protein
VEEDGGFYYYFDDKFRIAIKASDKDDQIAFYAFLLDGIKKRQGLFNKLLKHNFLLQETHGAAFAIAKGSGDICLCRFFMTQDMDVIEFEKHLNNFLFAANEWHNKLKDWLQQDEYSHLEKQDTGSMGQFQHV